MNKKIEALILDWAGTAVDFGCFAPVAAFQSAFEKSGLYPSLNEIRKPMGLQKRTHIKEMLKMERLGLEFESVFGRKHTEADVDMIYNSFVPALFDTLEQYAEPLPGVIETISRIRNQDIKIGSTTGYTLEMMEIVTSAAKKKGYETDCLCCAEEVGGKGRPYPYMIWKNLEKLQVKDVRNVIKIGDTLTDVEEGKNAGCITVGVLNGSSLMGLSYEEFSKMDEASLKLKKQQAEKEYIASGADYVIDEISDILGLIKEIEGGKASNV